jgi:hypothetical protein
MKRAPDIQVCRGRVIGHDHFMTWSEITRLDQLVDLVGEPLPRAAAKARPVGLRHHDPVLRRLLSSPGPRHPAPSLILLRHLHFAYVRMNVGYDPRLCGRYGV